MKWISVKDALPNNGRRVLATDGILTGDAYLSIQDNVKAWYRTLDWTWERWAGTGKPVIAWMDMPDYKEPTGCKEVRNLLSELHEAGDIEGACIVGRLMSDLNTATLYIPHTCHTCCYWELSQQSERMYCCTHPDKKNPCYAWMTKNWKWNGKPPEKSY